MTADGLLVALAARRRGRMPRGTHRMEALCRSLGSPHAAVPAIHVVGTDGKTSVARMITALLQAAGVHAGETTSPHLEHPGERLRIAGRAIDDGALAAAGAALQAAMPEVERQVGQPATFFEAVTALALRTFADADVEVAVVEAGIGGVGDATNVVTSTVAVVTPIGLDHAELGADLEAVAREKAAVVEPGGVLVAGPQRPQAAAAVEAVATERGARLLRIGDDAGVRWRRAGPDGQVVSLRGLDGLTVQAWLPVIGAHQAVNAATALVAVQAFLGSRELEPSVVREGLAAVAIPGRVELVRRPGEAEVVLDGAHDALAVDALVNALRELPPAGRCVVVLGVGGGRDAVHLVQRLRGVAATFVVTQAGSPTSAPAADVAARVIAAGVEVIETADPQGALAVAQRLVGPGDRLIVTGSLHVVGDVRSLLTVAAAVAA